MTPDRADVQVLQAMIDLMTGVPQFSYPARQKGAPKPAGEHAHVRVLEEYQVGIPNRLLQSETATTATYAMVSPVRLRYRVGVVDTTGLPSSRIMHGWTSDAMRALMLSTGYGFIGCTPISSEDALLEKEWEYRKGFSIEMYTTRVFLETVDLFTTLTITGEYHEGSLVEVLGPFEINQT